MDLFPFVVPVIINIRPR